MLSRIFWALCSLKLAVFVILGLAFSLATATILESVYDTPTAQFWVYQSTWFYCLLGLLGLNILCVALSRWPWKKRHTAFLLAHAGILILLAGSWLTDLHGLDGSLRIVEGESNAQVETASPVLYLSEGSTTRKVPIRWTPPNATFRKVTLSDYGLEVDQLISHADVKVAFAPATSPAGGEDHPAVHLKLEGGPMRISQDFWLWSGDPAWSLTQAGPARLALVTSAITGMAAFRDFKGPMLTLTPTASGDLMYDAHNSEGQKKSGRIPAAKIASHVIEPGWKGGVKITLLEWIPHAESRISYFPSKMQYGTMAPPPAIHLTAGSGEGKAEIWLGLGDRANLQYSGRDVQIGFFNQRQVLPFSIKLNQFRIERYEGTHDPASYSSNVSVIDDKGTGEPVTISMNEPLVHNGITFYQASYEDAEPRPTVTILSVNRDPGRWMKYIGSLLIVFGSILLFAGKYKKKGGKPAAPASEVTA